MNDMDILMVQERLKELAGDAKRITDARKTIQSGKQRFSLSRVLISLTTGHLFIHKHKK
ncbi:MAG: hypothetical protein JW760_14285 [Spirochaetales bacterium]|nr:hypothetical protein [Spirochaetales bacterium]